MSKKNYKKSRKYKKMRRRKIIFGIEITVLLILSGILFVYAWISFLSMTGRAVSPAEKCPILPNCT